MTGRSRVVLPLVLVALVAPPVLAGGGVKARPAGRVSWKKTVIDPAFRSEGVAVADVNKDGRLDLIVGDCWYEAPKEPAGTWTRHVLRADRRFDPRGYSDSFACFADDFNGDGWPDVVVIPFPGNPCYWYENPGPKGGPWKQHLVTNSACNETPIFVDLFKTGKRVLVMGWQPEKIDAKGKKQGNHDDRGEMCYFVPGKDATQPWERHSISGPSTPGKFEVPGTRRFSHGLGHGDVNGDGRLDVICTGGWWEQPERDDGTPWKFHPANLGEACADMFAFDLDGDGKADVISSSAHSYGFWWYQHKAGKEVTFLRREILPTPQTLAKEPAGIQFGKEERAVYNAVNALREREYRRAPLVANPELCRMARDYAERLLKGGGGDVNISGSYKGKVVAVARAAGGMNADMIARMVLEEADKGQITPGCEVGIGYAAAPDGPGRYTLIVGDRRLFSLPSETHAMHFVDIDGDGLKDLVTGRRWWAHAPDPKGHGGDPGVNDPAYLYWFRAARDRTGLISFVPELIDDDSGVGTQFEVADINGDGLLDIIISNKKGVFIFEQVRIAAPEGAPPRRED